jgi:hypothetical protein
MVHNPAVPIYDSSSVRILQLSHYQVYMCSLKRVEHAVKELQLFGKPEKKVVFSLEYIFNHEKDPIKFTLFI